MNMMEIAVWIIAILEIVRAVQNAMQLRKSRKLLQMHAKANADLERTMTHLNYKGATDEE